MKTLFLGLIFLFSTVQAHARFDEVARPEEMVSCMHTYIRNWIAAPATVSSWEHRPAYEFDGKYFFASWHTNNPVEYYGSLDLMVGPNAPAPIYCDYPTGASGTPDRNKGFCKAKVKNGNVLFNYTTYNRQGQPVKTQKKIAIIQNSKILCLNLPRP